MGKWIMTEHKVIVVGETRTKSQGGLPVTVNVTKALHPGDEAPPGHEGRPYTRLVEDDPDEAEQPGPRIDMGGDSRDRMDRGAGAIKRGRKPRKE